MGSPGSSARARARLHLHHCGGRHRRRLLPGLWQSVSGRVWGGAGVGRAWRRSGRGGKGRSQAGEAVEGERSQCGARRQRAAEEGGGQCGAHGREGRRRPVVLRLTMGIVAESGAGILQRHRVGGVGGGEEAPGGDGVPQVLLPVLAMAHGLLVLDPRLGASHLRSSIRTVGFASPFNTEMGF